MSERPLKLSVVIVEDREEDVEVLKYRLTKAGLDPLVTVFANVATALQHFENIGQDPLPDLVFLDLYLPDGWGIEILNRFQASDLLREIPVIVLTASDRVEDKVDAYKKGGTIFLQKQGLREDILMELVRHLAVTGRINPRRYLPKP